MNSTPDPKPRPMNLVGASLAELTRLMAPLDPRPFRAQQVHHWLIRRLATSLAEMTDLPKALRQELSGFVEVRDSEVLELRRAADGTAKYALRLDDGQVVEAVAMPMEGRTTLCLSSQTGCALGCVFCVTGVLGRGRNLSAGEIFSQYRVLVHREQVLGEPLNVVFMGMGEPLLNFSGLTAALELLYTTVSPRRVTVSTSGVVPGIVRLGSLERRPNLAVSLNATTQEQRHALMPVVARWPLEDLLRALRDYPLERGRRITVEYVLVGGVNDSAEDAGRLPRLLGGLPVKVNLIPLNPDEQHLPGLTAPAEARVDAFAATLASAHLNVTVRRSRGREVAAACGQLRGRLTSR